MPEKFHKQPTLPTYEDLERKEDLPIPEKIGPYKIETLLAEGGMSILYLGVEPETKEARVVKVLSPTYLNHPEMMDHFLWEAKIIGMTSHPNIVKIYDWGKWEGGLYIGMEFVQGVSLCQFIAQQSFSLKRCLDIILQVCYALLHLHTHGVIHRDLKPENILISEDGEVKVIDFGIAQLHEDVAVTPRQFSRTIGTPSYMSPEQKANPANASFASDIFSLGIILYELVLGKLSYGMINVSLLPAGLQKIVSKALAISVSERYQDIVDFITDLTAYYKSSSIEKDRPGGDQVIEFMETMQRAEQSLSTFEKPHWPQFDIGIYKERTSEQIGFYLDFFKFANNTSAIILAHPHSAQFSSVLSMAVLRGMVKSLLQPALTHVQIPFNPIQFASALNELVCQDKLKEQFHLSILKLIPINDSLIFLSCGQGPLFHVPHGTNSARLITSDNPLIGADPTSTFNDTTDYFNEGDLAVLHSFPSPFTHALQKELERDVLLSPGRLSEALFIKATHVDGFQELRHPKAIITLQRIA